jgi:hypothetical protein
MEVVSVATSQMAYRFGAYVTDNKDMKEHIYEHQLRFGATSTAVGLSPVSSPLPYDPLLEHRDRNKEQYYVGCWGYT